MLRIVEFGSFHVGGCDHRIGGNLQPLSMASLRSPELLSLSTVGSDLKWAMSAREFPLETDPPIQAWPLHCSRISSAVE